MELYILINTQRPNNPILGVYDSELLAEKRKAYFLSIYSEDQLKIVSKDLEYMDRE